MVRKTSYKYTDNHTVEILVEDDFGQHHIGTAKQNGKMKWVLTPHFPVEHADIEDIEYMYEGPVEAGQRLVKAWEFHNSQQEANKGNHKDFFFENLDLRDLLK